MFSRRTSRRKFVKDLTRTRHMTTVSAVILVTTFAPLLGMPDVEELHSFQRAVEGFSDARASVLEPRRDDEAARERSARSVIPEAAEPDRDLSAPRPAARRVLTVEHPDRTTTAPADSIDASAGALAAEELPPLPPADDAVLAAPVDSEPALPDVDETKPEAPPLAGEEPAPQDEPPPDEDEDDGF